MFQKAVKTKSKLRLAIEGASGSGKTFGALTLASAMGKRIAVIDTEHGSASLYADRFDFDVLELKAPYEPEKFIQAIQAAEKAGYEVIVIDSISHEWNGEGGCLQIVDKIGGNSYTAWGKVTPRHDAFINSMLKSSAHIIATMRSKVNYETGKDERTGKMTVEKKGTAPVQRDAVDYEFTVVFDLNQKHSCSVSKDRTSLFDGKDFMITEDTARQLLDWLNSGAEAKPKTTPPPTQNGTTIPPKTDDGQKNGSQPTKPTAPPVQSNVQAKPRATQDQMTRIKDLLREEEFLSGETIALVNEYLKTHPNPSNDAAVNMLTRLETEISENRQLVSQDAGKPSFEDLFGE